MDDLDHQPIDAMMSLADRCLELPYRERLSLCQALKDSILKEKNDPDHNHPNRGEFLLKKMEEILGEKIPVKSRESRYVWARAMVAYQLTQEGFTTMEVGRMIGKDHSTIIYLRDRMRDALSFRQAYWDIVKIWETFQKKINNDIHTGTTDNLIYLGEEHENCIPGEMGK